MVGFLKTASIIESFNSYKDFLIKKHDLSPNKGSLAKLMIVRSSNIVLFFDNPGIVLKKLLMIIT
jgi:hypothetical protein